MIGAGNPSLTHQALATEPSVAVLLPCNVVVRAHHGHSPPGIPHEGIGLSGRRDEWRATPMTRTSSNAGSGASRAKSGAYNAW
ncbi:MAG: DUF302 domain-containing protein [Acidimicrobiales bacterium]